MPSAVFFRSEDSHRVFSERSTKTIPQREFAIVYIPNKRGNTLIITLNIYEMRDLSNIKCLCKSEMGVHFSITRIVLSKNLLFDNLT